MEPLRDPEAAMRSWFGCLARSGVPTHQQEPLALYIVYHIRPGDFLRAVLENDLKGAMQHADATSARMLPELVLCLLRCAPYRCWGSRDAVAEWLKKDEAD